MRIVRLAAIGPLVLAVACAGAEAPAEYSDAVTADPDHYSIAFENDAVRVLRIAYGPGETSVMHHHPANCVIFLQDQAGTFELPGGEVEEMPAGEAGTVNCGDETVHLPTNTGAGDISAVLVEFKAGGSAGSDWTPEAPDAVTADPDHYTVEFENEVARIVRITYGPGETSVMHHHPAGCVTNIQWQPVTFELPDGEVVDAPVDEEALVTCNDGTVHLPTNTGEGELEAIFVELMGRAAAA